MANAEGAADGVVLSLGKALIRRSAASGAIRVTRQPSPLRRIAWRIPSMCSAVLFWPKTPRGSRSAGGGGGRSSRSRRASRTSRAISGLRSASSVDIATRSDGLEQGFDVMGIHRANRLGRRGDLWAARGAERAVDRLRPEPSLLPVVSRIWPGRNRLTPLPTACPRVIRWGCEHGRPAARPHWRHRMSSPDPSRPVAPDDAPEDVAAQPGVPPLVLTSTALRDRPPLPSPGGQRRLWSGSVPVPGRSAIRPRSRRDASQSWRPCLSAGPGQ